MTLIMPLSGICPALPTIARTRSLAVMLSELELHVTKGLAQCVLHEVINLPCLLKVIERVTMATEDILQIFS